MGEPHTGAAFKRTAIKSTVAQSSIDPSALARSALVRSIMAVGLVLIGTSSGVVRGEENPGQKARVALQQARAAYEMGKMDDAARLAKEASDAVPQDVAVQQAAGQTLFLAGSVTESLPCFERANKLDASLAPHNWQRGVALACAGKFEEGAEQFRVHHEVNPDDVENSAWYFLCVAKTKGKAAAEAAIIPSRGDRRQPMMSVLKMLRGALTPDEVLLAAKANTEEGPERKSAMFYGFLYVGLYYDSIGESEKGAFALERSIAQAEKDYMGRTAQLYRDLRFSKPASASKPKPAEPNTK